MLRARPLLLRLESLLRRLQLAHLLLDLGVFVLQLDRCRSSAACSMFDLVVGLCFGGNRAGQREHREDDRESST